MEDDHIKVREYLERIWQECALYVDGDAAQKATGDLAPVFWELHLARALKSAGKVLTPRAQLRYQRNKGPDLFADDPAVWLEAVVVTGGTGPDALRHGVEPGKVYDCNPDGVVLRMRSVIRDKSLKIEDYTKDGIVKPNQAAVIAISGDTLPLKYREIENPTPNIVRAVYPANNLVIEVNRRTMAAGAPYAEYRDEFQKRRGAPVRTDVFLDPAFAHISAVLYDDSNWVTRTCRPGADFKLVHNANATTPLPDGWLPRGTEYWWRDGSIIEWRKHASPR
jgi:hypothetical protein